MTTSGPVTPHGSGDSMALGYTIMVASFLLIYFGIRSYRDNTLAESISLNMYKYPENSPQSVILA